jgi:hypothetical protein
MTKILKVPAKINMVVQRYGKKRQPKVYGTNDRASVLAFSGDMKDWRSIVKGVDLF